MQSRLRRPRNKSVRILAVATFIVLAAPFGAAGDPPLPQARPSKAAAAPKHAKTPLKTVGAAGTASAAGTRDEISGAIPLGDTTTLPEPGTRAAKLHAEIARQKPVIADARASSERLNRQAADLQKQLIITAHRIEVLENNQLALAGSIARLSAENAILRRDFHKDRGTVTRQLAMLERLSHTLPPAIVLTSGDALKAARASMVMGATLPKIYQRTAALARRLERIRTVRETLTRQQQAAQENRAALNRNRTRLDSLVKTRQAQAQAASQKYQSLRDSYVAAVREAASLDALLTRIARLKNAPATRGWVSVSADTRRRPELIRPVSGSARRGGMDGVGGAGAPGLTYSSLGGAQVVAPGPGRIRYAGPYQNKGLVLILEMANGYDAVLAGLDRVSVQTGDQVLTGEPIGRLPASQRHAKLYFELRFHGQGLNPARYIDAG